MAKIFSTVIFFFALIGCVRELPDYSVPVEYEDIKDLTNVSYGVPQLMSSSPAYEKLVKDIASDTEIQETLFEDVVSKEN